MSDDDTPKETKPATVSGRPESPRRPVDLASFVPPEATSVVPTQQMVSVLQQLATPWAEAERAKHIEETKRHQEKTRRHEIDAGASKVYAICGTVIFCVILAIAFYALKQGARDVTEKIVIPVITAAAGYVAGRGHAAAKRKDDE